jgi:hypothetical protein
MWYGLLVPSVTSATAAPKRTSAQVEKTATRPTSTESRATSTYTVML